MLGTLAPLFFNLPMLIAVLCVLAAAAAVFFIEGLPALIADLLNWRIWVGVAAFLGLVAFINAGETIKKDQQQNAIAKSTVTAQVNTQAVITDVTKKKNAAVVVQKHLQDVINTAPVGDEDDAAWDAIGKDEASNNSSSASK